jgi:hypothetical protein
VSGACNTTGGMTYEEQVKRAIAAFEALVSEEQDARRREQAIDFAYGNLTCTGRRDYITREMVAKAYDRKHPK